jgi:plasmid stability protein
MRTTIDLPDDLLGEAKARAARDGRSLSSVVSDALRNSFSQAGAVERGAVALPTFDGGGLQPGVDLDDSVALLDLMERAD